MKLFKYKSLSNPWHLLDIVANQRLYCAHWTTLNDPLEGRFEVFLEEEELTTEAVSRIQKARDEYRIASLSADPNNLLMWSHYADGHKGVVVEVDIPNDHEDLVKLVYTDFSAVFNGEMRTKDMRCLFNGKTPEWAYEKEYRIITKSEFFNLPKPVKKILLGSKVDNTHREILIKLLPSNVEVVERN